MKIFFAVPSYGGIRCVPFFEALDSTIKLAEARGHEHILSVLSCCCYVQVARNELVKMFRDSDADVLVFLDDDLSWNPEDLMRMVEMPDDVLAGIYPKKTQQEDYPVVIRCGVDNRAIVRADGAISAVFVAAGFLSIKRRVIDKLCAAYPGQKYFKRDGDKVVEDYFDLFPQGLHNGQWTGEDFAFCRLWNDIGGEIWVIPDLELTHHKGSQAFTGNYHKFLLRQPGGSDAPDVDLRKASEITGWMTPDEMIWLAQQARDRKCIVELGSFTGRSTRAMADNTGGRVWAIDDWKGPRENLWKDPTNGKLYERFRANLSDLIDAGKVIPLRADHGDHAIMPDIQPDMVFIDGDHRYAHVASDIAFWKSRMKPGGLICGHDADWSDVEKALGEHIPASQVAPKTRIWYAEV